MFLYNCIGFTESDFFEKQSVISIDDFQKTIFEDSFYLESEKSGIEVLFDMDDEGQFLLNTIFIKDCEESRKSLNFYLGVDGLNFDLSENELIELLGCPVAEGGGERTLLGVAPRWFKFSLKNSAAKYYLHAEFNQDSNAIVKLTVT